MKAKILGIDSKQVRILTNLGELFVVWHGNTPVLFTEYEIELEIEDNLIIGQNVSLSNCGTTSITMKENITFINAEVISLEENGVIVIKLEESIMILEVEGDRIEKEKFIEIKASLISAYDINM